MYTFNAFVTIRQDREDKDFLYALVIHVINDKGIIEDYDSFMYNSRYNSFSNYSKADLVHYMTFEESKMSLDCFKVDEESPVFETEEGKAFLEHLKNIQGANYEPDGIKDLASNINAESDEEAYLRNINFYL